jgi:hypothetical protein
MKSEYYYNNDKDTNLMKTKYRWTITFCVATPFLLLLVMLLAGGGHGTFVPIIALFPFAALGIMSKLHSEILTIFLAIAQLPIYGISLDVSKTKGKFELTFVILAFVHIAAVVCSAILHPW